MNEYAYYTSNLEGKVKKPSGVPKFQTRAQRS